MILTCPSCATRYLADEAVLGGKGKLVRCATCRHTWRARASDVSAGDEDVDDSSLAEALEAHEDEHHFEDEPEEVFPNRPLAPGAPDMRGAVLGWGAAGAAVLALMSLAVLFRVEIVGLWPKTASIYAAAGFAVTAEGLVFEDVAAAPGYHEGEPTLTITASVRNTSGRTREVPPVWIGLFDRDGGEVFSWSVALEAPSLEPRQAARFTALLAQPPVDAQDLELRFSRNPDAEPVLAATEILGGGAETALAAGAAPEEAGGHEAEALEEAQGEEHHEAEEHP